MFERFTNRARKVMQLANREAQRFSHEYIGTEHVLLGLIEEGSGVAANVFKKLDIDPQRIRTEVESLVRNGPDMVTMGNLPCTPRVKKVIERAMEESRNLHQTEVGTEHILLGLLQEGLAEQVLTNFGLTVDLVRALIVQILRQGVQGRAGGIPSQPRPGTAQYPKEVEAEIDRLQKEKEEAIARSDFETAAGIRDQIESIKNRGEQVAIGGRVERLRQQFQSQMLRSQDRAKAAGSVQSAPDSRYSRFTDRARRVMQLANQEAQRFNQEYIGTAHLLLGLIEEGHGVGAHVLKNLNADLGKIRIEVEKLIESKPDMVASSGLSETPRAKKIIEYSMEEARLLDHRFVGTEHLLLGLLREKQGVAAQVLANLGLDLGAAREQVLEILARGIPGPERRAPNLSKLLESLIPEEIAAELRRLEKQKQEAVAGHDSATAAALQDKAEQLKNITLRALRNKVAQFYQRGTLRFRLPGGRDNAPIGVPPVPEDFGSRFSRRCAKVIELANREAIRRNNEYIGTEHLLLAMVRLGGGGAVVVLKQFGIDRHKVRIEIDKLIQSGPDMVRLPKLPKTPRTNQVLKYSWEEAWAMNSEFVETEHILLGILRETECVAAQVLFSLGIELESARQAVKNLPLK